MTASQQWADELAAWAIDPEILAAAPESPYSFPPELFRAEHGRGGSVRSPLLDVALEALPAGGSVLDVGSGAGAASLPLAPPASLIVAVDTQPSMLDELEAGAASRPVTLRRVEGQWPDVAASVPVCDVVVCSHVAYNVADLGSFARALAEHSRGRVVLELHATHPWVDLGPLWQQVHHQPRPSGPTAELAVTVLREHGIETRQRVWERPAPSLEGPLATTYVAFTRRRLCLPADRDPEVAAYLAAHPPQPRRSVVLWWDV
jgi:SAM-dependent methyltransferase